MNSDMWHQQCRQRAKVARKVERLQVLEALIEEWECVERERSLSEQDHEYLRGLRHRAHGVRTQLVAMRGE
jgi:hypothetical protein